MCLILFAHRAHPQLPLVVAANRDEYYGRPSQTADFWPDAPQVLAGRDLEAGGTWLGLSRSGRFAAVTNVRGHSHSGAARSRGELTRDFLMGDMPARDYAHQVLERASLYRGFNLLIGDGHELVYCENLHQRLQVVEPGIYGLSNHLLDTPWPKVVSGKTQLTDLLGRWHSASEADSGKLLGLLTDRTIAEDDLLPSTGVGTQLERVLSPIFIEGESYGTCCSTALIVDKDRRVKFHERSFYSSTAEDAFFEFALQRQGES